MSKKASKFPRLVSNVLAYKDLNDALRMNFFLAAETLGFKSYAPAYLSPDASGKNLLIGSNFASAASGYDEKAAALNVSNFPDVRHDQSFSIIKFYHL